MNLDQIRASYRAIGRFVDSGDPGARYWLTVPEATAYTIWRAAAEYVNDEAYALNARAAIYLAGQTQAEVIAQLLVEHYRNQGALYIHDTDITERFGATGQVDPDNGNPVFEYMTPAIWAVVNDALVADDGRMIPLTAIIPGYQPNDPAKLGIDPLAYVALYIGVVRGQSRDPYLTHFSAEHRADIAGAVRGYQISLPWLLKAEAPGFDWMLLVTVAVIAVVAGPAIYGAVTGSTAGVATVAPVAPDAFLTGLDAAYSATAFPVDLTTSTVLADFNAVNGIQSFTLAEEAAAYEALYASGASSTTTAVTSGAVQTVAETAGKAAIKAATSTPTGWLESIAGNARNVATIATAAGTVAKIASGKTTTTPYYGPGVAPYNPNAMADTGILANFAPMVRQMALPLLALAGIVAFTRSSQTAKKGGIK